MAQDMVNGYERDPAESVKNPAGRSLKLLILLLCITALVMIFATNLIELIFASTSGGAREESDLAIALAFALIAIIGALAAMGQPRNAVGWVLLFSGLTTGLAGLGEGLGYYLMSTRPDSGIVLIVAWLAGIMWTLGLILLLLVFPFLFPDGCLPSRRWRPIFTIAMLFVAAVVAIQFFSPLTSRLYLDPAELDRLLSPLFLIFPVLALVGVVSLVVRYRQAGTTARQQMKWLLVAVGVPVLAFLLLSLAEEIFRLYPSNLIWGTLYLMIPVGLGISLLRYKLFDVDTVIRKTAQYAIITTLLALIYFGLIVVLQRLVTPLAGDSDVVVVLSTLLIAALFLPLRRRVQNVIDRRFYRRKYDAEKILAAFAATARDETDLDALTAELLRVIQETMEPEHVSLWLKPTTDGGRRTTDQSKII